MGSRAEHDDIADAVLPPPGRDDAFAVVEGRRHAVAPDARHHVTAAQHDQENQQHHHNHREPEHHASTIAYPLACNENSRKYSPPAVSSSSCVPCSITRPPPSTTIRSAPR